MKHRKLILSSIPMHRSSKIDESIAIDLLTLDDDDGVIENGTPRRPEICTGFSDYGMACPPPGMGLVVKGPDLFSEDPGIVDLELSYYLHTVSHGASTDPAEILISVDGGDFTLVASNDYEAAADAEYLTETPAWKTVRFDISDHLPATGPISVRIMLTFNARLPGDNYSEGFIFDDITLYTLPWGIGDVDQNGVVNIVDALRIAQHYVGLNPPRITLAASNSAKWVLGFIIACTSGLKTTAETTAAE